MHALRGMFSCKNLESRTGSAASMNLQEVAIAAVGSGK